MRRHLIGILALFLAVGALAFWWWPPTGAMGEQTKAACWRMAPLLGVLWLAYEELRRLPRWLFFVVLAVVVIGAVKPKTLILAGPLIVLLAVFRPRFGRPR